MNKNIKKIVYCAMCVALTFCFSLIKIVELPMGGAITLFSMLVLAIPGYFFGLKYGFLSAFAFSLLQLLQGVYYLAFLQFILDYILAFTCFGITGLFVYKKNGLAKGFVIACILRFICSALSGYVFFKEYTPEGWNPIIYVLAYNSSYIFSEMILSLIFISLPPIKRFIERIRISVIS